MLVLMKLMNIRHNNRKIIRGDGRQHLNYRSQKSLNSKLCETGVNFAVESIDKASWFFDVNSVMDANFIAKNFVAKMS